VQLTAPSTSTTTTTTTPGFPVGTPLTLPAPAAAPSTSLPSRGHATAWGCGPALDYLHAYADPSFTLICPGNAQGHQATTCIGLSAPCVTGQRLIIIADPCPAAYMNEAANSWSVAGGGGAIDPFGSCPR
jgi:hypothetical protein